MHIFSTLVSAEVKYKLQQILLNKITSFNSSGSLFGNKKSQIEINFQIRIAYITTFLGILYVSGL